MPTCTHDVPMSVAHVDIVYASATMGKARARRRANAGASAPTARGAVTPRVATSALMGADPVLARLVDYGLHHGVTRGTRSSYSTGARKYVKFCSSRGLKPWPVLEVTYCGWLHVQAAQIAMSSMDMYMAGVRDAAILEGGVWDSDSMELVRRTMRFLRKKYPAKTKGEKTPITVAVLRVILPLLPGWPDMAAMSEADRVFAAASVIAVTGFLRGGEFLASPKSDRATLAAGDVSIRSVGTCKAVVVEVRQPKARWWLSTVAVPCYAHAGDDTFCPVRLFGQYAARCGPRRPRGPAFVLGGKALTRDFMVSKTTALLKLAGIAFVNSKGVPMIVKAASWRAGAVCSAAKARISVPHIMAMGRWTSEAWVNYLLQGPADLQESAASMWTVPRLSLEPVTPGSLSVAEFNVGGFFAPHTIPALNGSMSSLGIDVEHPLH